MKQQKRNPRNTSGTIVIELTHAGIPDSELKPESFSEQQLTLLSALKQDIREKVLKGYPIIIMDLETRQVCTEFNRQNVKPSEAQIERFARVIYEKMRADFKAPKVKE